MKLKQPKYFATLFCSNTSIYEIDRVWERRRQVHKNKLDSPLRYEILADREHEGGRVVAGCFVGDGDAVVVVVVHVAGLPSRGHLEAAHHGNLHFGLSARHSRLSRSKTKRTIIGNCWDYGLTVSWLSKYPHVQVLFFIFTTSLYCTFFSQVMGPTLTCQ